MKTKPTMMIKWSDESTAQPITRTTAAHMIKGNRNKPKAQHISVRRLYGETYIAAPSLGVGCVIFKGEL